MPTDTGWATTELWQHITPITWDAWTDARRGHPIAALTSSQTPPDANELTVVAAGRSAVARDLAGQWKTGPLLDIIYDRTNATDAEATQHAGAALRDRLIAADQGELIPALPNIGQELYDVITVTHAAMGLTAVRRRVTGIRIDYRAGIGPAQGGSPRFEQRLTLGLP